MDGFRTSITDIERLLRMQEEIKQEGPEGFDNVSLITMEELRAIRRIWVFDKHEFDDSLPAIFEAVTGKKFLDPEWVGSEAFRKDEWDVLKSVCEDLFPEEELTFEMLYSMIDIENQSNSLNQRKGILDDLEKCISHTFYMNEEDATRYYEDRITRKKELGGKFNDKFFAHIQSEAEEFEGEVSEEESAIAGEEF